VTAKPDPSPFAIFVEGDTRPVDFDEVRRAVPVLFAPGERHELRSLPGARSRVVSADDVDHLVRSIGELDGMIYFSLNPIGPDADRAKASTVTGRRWLLVDIDPIRSGGVGATEAEKSAAALVVDAILAGQGAEGWPAPVVADSGNGWHLLYRIDLPNDKLSHQIVKKCLAAMAARYDTPSARVDTAVHDAPRICKLPGTWSRKGPDTAERPHRRARIAYVPHDLAILTAESLSAFGEPSSAPKADRPAASAGPFTATVGAAGLHQYVRAAIDRECVGVATEPEGSRNGRLNVAAFNLGTLAGWPEMDANEAQARLRDAADQAGLPELEARSTIASGWTAGAASPRSKPEPAAAKAAKAAKEADAKVEGLAGKRAVKYASEVTPKKIEFLWPGRIPLGKLTTFAGHGGLGKTFVLCDISARISTGAEWPFSDGECAEAGDVLFISGEDDEADTLVPRLMACGADRSRIAFLSDDFSDAFSLVSLKILAEAVKALRNPRMIVIDPPTNYLEGVDDHKNSELRSLVLRPLAKFASDHNVAIILNNHVNKSSGKDVEAACRVMGSVAWVNGVRTAYLFVRDESEPERVVIATIKTNVGKMPSAMTYRIVSGADDSASVEWIDEQTRTADQVNKATSAGAKAAKWLEDLFRTQREWPSADITRLAKDSGVSKRALFESPEVAGLPILKRKRTSSQGETAWFWIAETGWPSERESWESWESCSVSPDAATHMQDSHCVPGGGNLGGDGNLGSGGKQDSRSPPQGQDSHPPGTQREPWIPQRPQGLTEQDSQDSQDSHGGRDEFLSEWLSKQ